MPGGPKEAFDALEPILVKCAAQVSHHTQHIYTLHMPGFTHTQCVYIYYKTK
jgi:6-phosphogluconate dehydrogenase